VNDENLISPEAMFADLRKRVIGRPVSFRRLAANSILIFIDAVPGSDSGVTYWLEPTWHLRGSDRVLTGSREAQYDESAPDPNAGFYRASAALDSLMRRILLDVRVEPITGDLHLEFEGGFLLRTFVSDPADEEIWHIRDNVTGTRLCRTISGYQIQNDE
jgi:hypothetical protein